MAVAKVIIFLAVNRDICKNIYKRSKQVTARVTGLDNRVGVLHPPPGGTNSINTILLIIRKPWLLSVAQNALCTVVDKVSSNNEHKGNGIHPVNCEVKDLDSHNDGPEIACQETNVEECCTGHAKYDWSKGVEDEQEESVADEVTSDSTVPGGVAKVTAVEDASLCAVDEHAPERQLTNDFVHRTLGDQKLFETIVKGVESCAEKNEEITLDLIDRGPGVCSVNVVACDEDPKAGAANQNAGVLRDMVSDLEEDEGKNHNHDDCPKANKLCRQDCGVLVAENDKVIAFDVEKGQDDIAPAIFEDDLGPPLEAIFVDCVRCVDDVEKDVSEEGLKGRNRGALSGEE